MRNILGILTKIYDIMSARFSLRISGLAEGGGTAPPRAEHGGFVVRYFPSFHQDEKGSKISKCGAKTEIYSRVCGYFHPVSNWNKGKKEEFKDRKTFMIHK